MKISELKQLIKERMRSSYQDYMDFKKYLQGLEGVTDDQKTQLLRKPDKDLDVYVNQFKQGNFKAEDVERLLKENKMKRSELKQLIKEEILKEMAVTEMAKLKLGGGELTDLGKMIKRIVSANKGKSVSDISKQVKKNDNVKKWLADNPDQDLHANQLQRFIKVQIGDLELGKRGRKKKEDDKE